MNKVTIQSWRYAQFCNSILKLVALVILLTSTVFHLSAQTAIGGNTPDPSAMLDVQSQSKGVLFPRMTTAERNLITNAPTGLMIFNISENRLQINLGSPGNVSWESIPSIATITSIDCAGATLPPCNLNSGQEVSGVSVIVPYTGGNGNLYSGQSVTSTGVTGLTATLTLGTFNTGSGTLTYSISGTPSSSGTASFALDIGGQTCPLNLTVEPPFTISCTDAIRKGEMQPGITYNASSGVTVIVPYTDGNGEPHDGQTVLSEGSTGFTATLSAGTFACGSGNLTYEITGMGAAGTATFALNIGGSSCELDLEVKSCSAKIDPSTYKTFLCYNLGAYNTRKPEDQPSWEIHGGYWRWGTMQEAVSGPSGPGAAEANSGTVVNWNSLPVGSSGAWNDDLNAPMPNNPCPEGFRVPTIAQWQGVISNNTPTDVGGLPWVPSPTNYTTGKKYGSLFLPATGIRGANDNGELFERGKFGFYWSSTEKQTDVSWILVFNASPPTNGYFSRDGISVRCIEGL